MMGVDLLLLGSAAGDDEDDDGFSSMIEGSIDSEMGRQDQSESM